MKLSELRKLIDEIDDERQKEETVAFQGKEFPLRKEDPEVMIEIKDFSHVIYGGTPTVCVERIFSGFDWDYGKLVIVPIEPLMKVKDNRDKFYYTWDVDIKYNKENCANVSS